MRERRLFTGVSTGQPSLILRLADELTEASREFRRNPQRYIKDAFRSDQIGGQRRRVLLRFGLAVGTIVYCVVFITVLILGAVSRPRAETTHEPDVYIWNPIFTQKRLNELPKAKDESGGGGGGGNRSLTPASKGEPPPASHFQQVVAPTTRPQLTPPLLPVQPTVWVNPDLLKPPDAGPMGLPDGIEGLPSDGPGSDRGVGNGKGGGVGPGNGVGFGPGNKKGIGGNDYSPGGNPQAGAQEPVDSRPVALNRPRPNYTEEARKNKIQGTIRLRMLVGNNGMVRQVRPITFLSDGLTEEAIRAAMQMRFRPAMRGGRAVDYWIPVDIEFNLR